MITNLIIACCVIILLMLVGANEIVFLELQIMLRDEHFLAIMGALKVKAHIYNCLIM